MTLGERISYHRNRLGLSQGELAGRMNVSRQAVSKWETDGSLPDLDRLIALSGLFGLTLDELVKGEEQEPADPAAAESPGAPAPRPAAQGQRTVGYVLLGVGLAMDAFSVSLANGLNEPHMSRRRMLGIAGVFAAFQALMPMTGWICVHTIVQYFRAFEKLIPWIALALLGFIGGKMLIEGIRGGGGDDDAPRLGLGALLVQGVATSIDALSVGFTIAEYDWLMALVCSLIIAAVTLCICLGGLVLGRKFGMRLAGRAQILGGAILIFIGLEIFISSML